jgi:Zn-dependent peptidase ImmA (M78 family)
VINSRLPPLDRLEVFFHELAHCLFHAPARQTAVGFHHVGRRTRQEHEADAFALCALMPRTLLAQRTQDEWLTDGFTLETITARLDIYNRHRI